MNDRLFIVQTTLTGDLNEAEVGFWAQSFVDSKLSSCIHINKSISIYTWKGEIIVIMNGEFNSRPLIPSYLN